MRRTIVLIGLLVVLVTASVITILLSNQDNFTGSRTRNPDAYLLDFTSMNQKDTHTIQLEKDDVLDISYTISKGKVQLTIQQQGGAVAYRSDKLEDGSFSVIVNESGSYLITVEAKRAKGFLHITKR